MADLNDTAADWESGVYQIETTDPVVGGAPNPATGAGMSNIPHLQLARRTNWLKTQVEALAALLTDALTIVRLRITGTGDAALTSTNHGLQIGPTAGLNLIGDVNEIMARNNGAASTLHMNRMGGDVIIGDPSFPATITVNGDMTGPRLRLTAESDAAPGSSSHAFQIGPAGGANLRLDPNEIMAVNNGSPATLSVNADGGDVNMGGGSSTLRANGLAFAGPGSGDIASEGWQRLPSGLIMQWGGASGGSSSGSVTFPIAFPTAALGVMITDLEVSASNIRLIAATNAGTTTGFSYVTAANGGGTAAPGFFRWFALGH